MLIPGSPLRSHALLPGPREKSLSFRRDPRSQADGFDRCAAFTRHAAHPASASDTRRRVQVTTISTPHDGSPAADMAAAMHNIIFSTMSMSLGFMGAVSHQVQVVYDFKLHQVPNPNPDPNSNPSLLFSTRDRHRSQPHAQHDRHPYEMQRATPKSSCCMAACVL